MKFLNTHEALRAKHEAEAGRTKDIGSLKDFDKWVNKIAKRNKR